MGHEEFVELVRRMREEQRTEQAGLCCEDCQEPVLRADTSGAFRLEKEVDAAIGMMDGKAWCEGWRQAAKEGVQ